MTFKRRIYLVVFVLLGFVAELLFLGYLATQVLEADVSSKHDFFPPRWPVKSRTDLNGADLRRKLSWTYN